MYIFHLTVKRGGVKYIVTTLMMIYNCSDFCRRLFIIIKNDVRLSYPISLVTTIQNIDYMIIIVTKWCTHCLCRLLKASKCFLLWSIDDKRIFSPDLTKIIRFLWVTFFFLARALFITIVTRKEYVGKENANKREKMCLKEKKVQQTSAWSFFPPRPSSSSHSSSSRSQNTYSDDRSLRTMLFPSSRPPRVPLSTMDSRYDSTPAYSSSSYRRWSRSPEKSYNTRRTANSASSRRYQYQNVPFSDILHNQYARQQQPIYSPISPRQSLLNNLTT